MKSKHLFSLMLVFQCTLFFQALARSGIKTISNDEDWHFIENRGQLTDEHGQPLNDIKYYGQQGNVFVYCRPGIRYNHPEPRRQTERAY